MAQTKTRDSPFSEPNHLQQHKARTLQRAPNAGESTKLLAELAERPCLFSPVPADKPLALYGAGNLGGLARDFLAAVGQDFVAVIDRNAGQLSLAWPNVTLFAPQDVPETLKRRARVAVTVVTAPYVPIEHALLELGFDDVVPFYDLAETFRAVHPLSNGWFAPPLTAQDREKTAEVLQRWCDDISRAHHIQFLAWRRLREEWTFENAPTFPMENRFFMPEVAKVLRRDETLLDGGAHVGLVSQAFIARTAGEFRQIIAIEPDPANREQLGKNLGSDPRLTVRDFALSNHEGDATFHAGLDYASQLSPTGKSRVKTKPIDTIGVAPTFVKLHLEGAELSALQGARQTLLKSRPIVAATIYHNADGIWRTPLWLMQTLADYRFLFRAHSWCGTGAVVYAIPNERSGA